MCACVCVCVEWLESEKVVVVIINVNNTCEVTKNSVLVVCSYTDL